MSKNDFSRRKFIKAGAYATLAAGVPVSLAGCGGSNSGGSSATGKRAIVIGSGFAGAVTALRLGQAGISTALIERGQRWVYSGPDSFPTLADLGMGDKRTTWMGEVDAASGQIPTEKYTGMLERISGDNVDAVCGAGLGGGSLVYGGVLLQPKQEYFEMVLPNISYSDMATKYYPRVLDYVSGGPIPDDILAYPQYSAKRAFIADATAGGLEIAKSHVGFNWDVIREELTGGQPAAASIGDYVFSCNSGAKNTLDRNYIAAAESTGKVQVYTLHNVVTISRLGLRGPYEVICDRLNEDGLVVGSHRFVCEYVFLAAGSLNTTKLLLKVKALGDLKGINDAVGQNWGANGDELMAVMGVTSDLGPVQGGPPSIAAWDNNNTVKPVGFMHSPSNNFIGMPPTQLQMAMTVSDQLGSISYNANTDSAFINWDLANDTNARQARLEALQKIATNSGGMILQDTDMGRPVMWHPVGGAIMGEATDPNTGELYGQPGLFVMDGALMPGSTAMANPSLTIAANAERLMENILPLLV